MLNIAVQIEKGQKVYITENTTHNLAQTPPPREYPNGLFQTHPNDVIKISLMYREVPPNIPGLSYKNRFDESWGKLFTDMKSSHLMLLGMIILSTPIIRSVFICIYFSTLFDDQRHFRISGALKVESLQHTKKHIIF